MMALKKSLAAYQLVDIGLVEGKWDCENVKM